MIPFAAPVFLLLPALLALVGLSTVQRRVSGGGGARANPCDECGDGCACGGCEAATDQIVQTRSLVSCRGECTPTQMAKFSENFEVCQPRAQLTCGSKRLFIVDPDTRLVFFFAGCTIDGDPSEGGCPTSSAPLYYDPCKDEVRVDLPDGTYFDDIANAAPGETLWVKVDKCPTCRKRPVFYDAEGEVFFTIPPIDVLDVAVEVTLCGSNGA